MKISTLKKMLVMSCVSLLVSGTTMALNHGSMAGTAIPLHEQGNASVIRSATLDYKVVTLNNETWAWFKTNNGAITGDALWAAQLRYWAGGAEFQTLNRQTEGNSTEAWVKATAAIPNPLSISFFVVVGEGFSETDQLPYDITDLNSKDNADTEEPVLGACSVGTIAETSVNLNLNATDNSGQFFFHIKDEANGVEAIAFRSDYILEGLNASTNYSVTVTPIDFSGNEGTPKVLNFTTSGLIHITSGVAKDIRFVLVSTGTELEYHYEFTDPSKKFEEAFLRITPAGGSVIEVKPTVSRDRSYVYGKTNDARIANKILSLNCGYLIYEEGGPNWGNYVMENTTITEGGFSGTAIKHQMGGGIHESERETVIPVLNNVTVEDVTDEYIKLNLDGSDNSGVVYYEISGAEGSVNSFYTGSYHLTNIKPGNIYDLRIVAKDLSGNYSEAKTVKVKTVNARTNIFDNENLNFNSLTKPGATGGELTSIIKLEGNKLTIGCTTDDSRYTGKTFHPKEDEAFQPTVIINGTSYVLDRIAAEEGNTEIQTATITFDGVIGEGENAVVIEDGVKLSIKWSVFWSAPNNGNFFTETFSYTVGDEGQTDTDAPEKPVLYLNGNILTWAACKDVLSGVKHYRVEEQTQTRALLTTIIPDLGETSFSYTLANPTNTVTVTAVDFAGNERTADSIDEPTGIKGNENELISVYPNPATNVINITGDVVLANIYSLQGQLLLSANINTIDVSSLNSGLYILKVTLKNDTNFSIKVQVKK